MDDLNKTAQITIFVIVGILVIAAVIFIFAVTRTGLDLQGEDSWIKDSKGIYVKHGNPASIPDYVKEQRDAILCAENLYLVEKDKGVEFNSECLGSCDFGEGYAVDIVHVPRTDEDNKVENQCSDYRNGVVKSFIELDVYGNIVRVA